MPVSVSHRNQESQIPKPGGRYKSAQDHPNPPNLTATKTHKGHKNDLCVYALRLRPAKTNEAGSIMRENVRSRQSSTTNLASNLVAQPRSGETSLALGDRGESREPSVTLGRPIEAFGGEGLCNYFNCLYSNRNIPVALRCFFLAWSIALTSQVAAREMIGRCLIV